MFEFGTNRVFFFFFFWVWLEFFFFVFEFGGLFVFFV